MATTGKSAARGHRLLWLLAGTIGLYLLLLPWLRHKLANAHRIEQEIASRQGQSSPQALVPNVQAASRALQAAREAVVHAPASYMAHLEMAKVLKGMGRLPEAAREAQAAVRLAPDNADALLVQADIAQLGRDFIGAMAAYRACLRYHPHEPAALARLGYLYTSFAWTDEARALLEPAVRAMPQNPRLKVALALVYLQSADIRRTETLLRDARRLAPDDATIWTPLIQVYTKSRRYKEAEAIALSALQQRPDDPLLYAGLGQVYYLSGSMAQADAILHQALAREPDNVAAHYYLALVHQAANQPADALRELETVLRLNPDFEQTRLLLGQAYLQSGRGQEGRALLTAFHVQQTVNQVKVRALQRVASNPRDPERHWQMALAYQGEDNLPRMAAELDKTLSLDPTHARARRLLAQYAPSDPVSGTEEAANATPVKHGSSSRR